MAAYLPSRQHFLSPSRLAIRAIKRKKTKRSFKKKKPKERERKRSRSEEEEATVISLTTRRSAPKLRTQATEQHRKSRAVLSPNIVAFRTIHPPSSVHPIYVQKNNDERRERKAKEQEERKKRKESLSVLTCEGLASNGPLESSLLSSPAVSGNGPMTSFFPQCRRRSLRLSSSITS